MQTEYKAPVRYKQRKLLIAYLSGKTIEYFDKFSQQWLCVYRYESPIDVNRLCEKNYRFRIKE